MFTDDWPILLVEFPETRVADAALENTLLHLEELFRRAKESRERTFTITDLSRMVEFPPSSQRAYTNVWLQKTIPLQREASLGGATVARSSMLRGFINTVHMISPPPLPSVFVATRRDAYVEAVRAFDAGRIVLKDELRTALTRHSVPPPGR